MESLLTVEQLSKVLAVTKATVYRWVRTGKLPCSIQLAHRATRFKFSDVEAWLKNRTNLKMKDS